MTCLPRQGDAIQSGLMPVKVRDVSGRGDTVAAVLAVVLAAGRLDETALRMATTAGGVAVSKEGTAIVTSGGIAAEKSSRMPIWRLRKRSWR